MEMKNQNPKKIKKYKSTCITLLSGKKLRVMKREVADVAQQNVSGGGHDVIVCMKSGKEYISQESKSSILTKITN